MKKTYELRNASGQVIQTINVDEGAALVEIETEQLYDSQFALQGTTVWSTLERSVNANRAVHSINLELVKDAEVVPHAWLTTNIEL